MKIPIKINVNGEDHLLDVKPNHTLLDVLRQDLGLIGTKKGCGLGKCGACTVLVDGEAVNACLMLALEADGSDILTIEGLAEGGKLTPIQEAFVNYGAVQCGFCTPGMIMATKVFLEENQDPSDEEIKKALAGHLCRCTGYVQIIDAVRAAAENGKET